MIFKPHLDSENQIELETSFTLRKIEHFCILEGNLCNHFVKMYEINF